MSPKPYYDLQLSPHTLALLLRPFAGVLRDGGIDKPTNSNWAIMASCDGIDPSVWMGWGWGWGAGNGCLDGRVQAADAVSATVGNVGVPERVNLSA